MQTKPILAKLKLMSKSQLFIFKILICFFIVSVFITSSLDANATGCPISLDKTTFPFDFNGQITITSQDDCFQTSADYTIAFYPKGTNNKSYFYIFFDLRKPSQTTVIVANLNLSQGSLSKSNPGTWIMQVCLGGNNQACNKVDNILATTEIEISKESVAPTPTPTIPANFPKIDTASQTQCTFQTGSDVAINRITNIKPNTSYRWWWDGDWGTQPDSFRSDANGSDLSVTIPGAKTVFTDNNTVKKLCIDIEGLAPGRGCSQNSISLKFQIQKPQGDTSCNPETREPDDVCTNERIKGCAAMTPSQVCIAGQCVQQSSAKGKECPGGKQGVLTAIGCIPTEPSAFVQGFIKVAIGAGGGIALLLMIYGAFQMITSAGNPDGVKKGSEQITSAVIGLLFIIFAVMLLKIIGVDILQIPGFEK